MKKFKNGLGCRQCLASGAHESPRQCASIRCAAETRKRNAPKTTAALTRFLHGQLNSLTVPDFLAIDEAQRFVEAARMFTFKRYDIAPEVGIIGTALVDHTSLSEYLESAKNWSESPFLATDVLLRKITKYIADQTGTPCEVLCHNGHKFHAGNWRLLTGGAGIHIDNIVDDCKELSYLNVEFQGSVVLHLETPGYGGETIVYDKKAELLDQLDPLFIESGWKFSQKVVEGANATVVPAVVGSLVFLPTLRYHEVLPSKSNSDRISFSAFIVRLRHNDSIYLYS